MAKLRPGLIALLLVGLLNAGCASFLSNTSLLSESHLGTPYSGTRRNVHTLYCIGRGVGRNSSDLLIAPLALMGIMSRSGLALADDFNQLDPDCIAKDFLGGHHM